LTEKSISTLVSNGSIYAKIDRPAKLVSFHRPFSPEEQLSNWSGKKDENQYIQYKTNLVYIIFIADISQLLRLVETTCHLINKENMIHKI
jgi:26S proteasome regulatory subunit N5